MKSSQDIEKLLESEADLEMTIVRKGEEEALKLSIKPTKTVKYYRPQIICV